MSTEGERAEIVSSGSATGPGNVEGLRRLKVVRGGNRAIITKIRESCSIISDRDVISRDDEFGTLLISIADTLKENRSLIECMDQKILL